MKQNIQGYKKVLMFICCLGLIVFPVSFSCQEVKSAYAIHMVSNEYSDGQATAALLQATGEIYSSNMILLSLDDDEVIGEISGRERIYPASLTKIMTTIVAIEHLSDLSARIIVSEEMFSYIKQEGASVAGFLPDEEVKAIDLLYGTILPSGADAALALADYIAGSDLAFAELMNQKAADLGMSNTHFVNATGLHDENHYTTLEDMVTLLKYAISNQIFKEIFTTAEYQTSPTNLNDQGLQLKSSMQEKLDSEEISNINILGGKTGYTSHAGLCLASFAIINNKEYVLITAGAKGSPSSPAYHVEDAVTIYKSLAQ